MKEAWWINGKTGKYFQVEEHAIWVIQSKNAKKLGLPTNIIKEISSLDSTIDRIKILTTVMHEGMIRVRGHDLSTSFEFSLPSSEALWAIYNFGKKTDNFGPLSSIYFANLRTNENYETTWDDFKTKLSEDGPEAILRIAYKELKLNYKVRKIANDILKQI